MFLLFSFLRFCRDKYSYIGKVMKIRGFIYVWGKGLQDFHTSIISHPLTHASIIGLFSFGPPIKASKTLPHDRAYTHLIFYYYL